MTLYRSGSGIWMIGEHRAGLTRVAAAGPSWTPDELADLERWWDFSDAATLFTDAGTTPVSSDGALIYQANDQSGNGDHAVQATAGNRPEYKTAIQNGRAAALFTASDPNWLGISLIFAGAGTVMIAQQTSGDMGLIGANGPNPQFRIGQSGGNVISTYDGTNNPVSSTFATARTGWTIVGYRWTGGTVSFYENGIPRSSGVMAGGGPGTANRIGTISGALYAQGYIGEIVQCGAALSNDDANLLGAYMTTRWGLSWTTIS
jgi:hypothetical protein